MAGELINQSAGIDIGGAFAGAFSSIPGFNTILQISKAVGIVVIIYLVVLIIKAIIQTRQHMRLKIITKNVEEINKKMDLLIGKKKK